MNMEPNKDETTLPAAQAKKDDALFEALGKSKKQKKRRILRTVLIIVLVIALALVVGISVLRKQVRERFAREAAQVESYEVATGTISTLVSGSGMLMNMDTEALTVPTGVEVTQILVDYGDTVEEGDLLALVDLTTVTTALSDIQTEIKSLDSQIQTAAGDTVANSITAGVSGRVKAIYAEAGEAVQDVMVEHGALAVLSLDGYMAVKVEAQGLNVGDSVRIVREDGTVLDAFVESAAADMAVILMTDDGPLLDEQVQITDLEGGELGSGKLYIHNPLAVTGYAGTINRVSTRENAKVWAGNQLFGLKDTSDSANYNTLLRSRSEKEEVLLELLKLQKYGGITAPIGGSVFSVADLDSEEELTDIVVLSPDVSMSVTISVDESDILALELGQQADITVRSVGEEVLCGVVTEIDKTAADGAYTAVVELDKVEGMLQGMTANIDVKIQGVENAIIIPVDALHQTSTTAYVYTTYDEALQEYGGRVDVTTGLSNDDYVEITSGLKVGDTVYYTESQDFFSMFGMGMPGGMGQGGNRGGQSGGNRMPSGGGMPSGGMPSGGMPSGGFGGGMPGGR